MEETVVAKRPREEPQVLKEEDVIIDGKEPSSKRHKPYIHILSLLESEELEDSTQEDLSPLITTLQNELITYPSESDDSRDHVHTLLSPSQNNSAQHNILTTTTTTSTSLEDCNSTSTTSATTTTTTTHSSSNGVLEEDDKERVMRHLLEASDDELGIPNRAGEEWSSPLEDFGEDGFSGNGDMFSSICDTDGLLWELEDETANYHALLQSELFLW